MPSRRIKALKAAKSGQAKRLGKVKSNNSDSDTSSVCSTSGYSSLDSGDVESLTESNHCRISPDGKNLLFLVDCFKNDILLEGLVASIVIQQPEVTKIFLSDLARLKHYHRRGDVHTMVTVMRQWCNSLQSEIKRRTSLTTSAKDFKTWCAIQEIDEQGLIALESLVKEQHQNFISLHPPAAKKQLRFNTNTDETSKNLSELLLKHNATNLSVYRGHPKLGYMELATKKVVEISRESVFSLLSRPPWFLVILNREELTRELPGKEKTSGKKDSKMGPGMESYSEGRVLLRMEGHEIRSLVLENTGLSIQKIKENHCMRRFKINSVGREVGASLNNRSMSVKVGEEEENIYIVYDVYSLSVDCYCTESNWREARKLVFRELQNARTEKKLECTDLPYPFSYSTVRARVSTGGECKNFLDESQSCVLDIYSRQETKSLIAGHSRTKNVLINSLKFETPEKLEIQMDRMEDDSLHRRLVKSRKHALNSQEPVQFEKEVLIKARWTDKPTAATSSPIAQDRIRTILQRLLLKCDIDVSSTGGGCVCLETCQNSKCENTVDILFTFPNTICARHAVEVLVSHEKTNPQFCILDLNQIHTELKILSFTLTSEVYSAVGFLVKEKLDRLRDRERVVEQYCVAVNEEGTRKVEVLASSTQHVILINNTLSSIIEPLSYNCSGPTRRYLQSREGAPFIKLINHLTGAHVMLPGYMSKVHIYGTSAAKDATVKLLEEIQKAFKDHMSNDFPRWFLIDFKSLEQYRSEAMIDMIKQDKFKDSTVKYYHLDATNFHLWLYFESDKDHSQYMESINSILFTENQANGKTNKATREESSFDDTPLELNIFDEEPSDATNQSIESGSNGNASILEENPEDETGEEEDLPWLENKKIDPHCLCCYMEFNSPEDPRRYISETCTHALCTACISRHIRFNVQNGTMPLTLPCHCNAKISLADLRYILPTTRGISIGQVAKQSIRQFVAPRTDEYRWCPRPDCPGVSRLQPRLDSEKHLPEYLICLCCSGKICGNCMERYHGPTSCDGKQSAEAWMKADMINRKYCPSCRMGIEKVDGCNNVHCVNCHHYTCWTCNKFSNINAQKVYDHLTKEHGGY